MVVFCTTVLAFVLGGLNGCGNQKVKTYAKQAPELSLQNSFNDNLYAYGIFTDRLQFPLHGWMYLIDPKVLLNKATMTKFGVCMGEVPLFL